MLFFVRGPDNIKPTANSGKPFAPMCVACPMFPARLNYKGPAYLPTHFCSVMIIGGNNSQLIQLPAGSINFNSEPTFTSVATLLLHGVWYRSRSPKTGSPGAPQHNMTHQTSRAKLLFVGISMIRIPRDAFTLGPSQLIPSLLLPPASEIGAAWFI